MTGVARHRIEVLNRLLDTIEEDLNVLKRRLAKSGAKHFAVARFDALDHICQTCFRELESESTAEDSEEDRVLARVSDMNQELDWLSTEYQKLADWQARPKRTRERTQALIAELKGGAGFTTERPTSKRRQPRFEQPANQSERHSGARLDLELDTEASGDEVPLALSGVFVRRRPSR